MINIKKILCTLMVLILGIGVLAACNPQDTDAPENTTVPAAPLTVPQGDGKILKVLNWQDYIADGTEDSLDVISEFEERTGITVQYEVVPSNEYFYNKLVTRAENFDIVIPSDYMLGMMIDEGLVQKLDYNLIPNWVNILDEYKNPSYDPQQEYTVPYFVGLVGLFYNSALMNEVPESWEILWDEEYTDKFMMIDDHRDSFAIAQSVLEQNFNTQERDDWTAAAEKIKELKHYGWGDDNIREKLETNEILMAPWYNGDIYTVQDKNANVTLVYPKEGVNSFIDALAIPASSRNVAGAHDFINFLLEPDIALENAEWVCYASPNRTVVENPEYELYEDEYLYPENPPKSQVFTALPTDLRRFIVDELWADVRR